jgi:hypothetical protein
MDDKQRIHQKRLNAGRKAVETKGQKELNRAGQMAKWTKLYGNNDKETPPTLRKTTIAITHRTRRSLRRQELRQARLTDRL